MPHKLGKSQHLVNEWNKLWEVCGHARRSFDRHKEHLPRAGTLSVCPRDAHFSLPWRKFKWKLISILYKNKSIQSKMYLQVIFGELMLHLTIYWANCGQIQKQFALPTAQVLLSGHFCTCTSLARNPLWTRGKDSRDCACKITAKSNTIYCCALFLGSLPKFYIYFQVLCIRPFSVITVFFASSLSMWQVPFKNRTYIQIWFDYICDSCPIDRGG